MNERCNARGEPAEVCYVCGKRNTADLDPTTRECHDCGAEYAIPSVRLPQTPETRALAKSPPFQWSAAQHPTPAIHVGTGAEPWLLGWQLGYRYGDSPPVNLQLGGDVLRGYVANLKAPAEDRRSEDAGIRAWSRLP